MAGEDGERRRLDLSWTHARREVIDGAGGLEWRSGVVSAGLGWRARLVLDSLRPLAVWQAELHNHGGRAVEGWFVWMQDLGLADEFACELNVYFVSHYVSHFAKRDERLGWLVASRQNLPVGKRHPATVAGCLEGAESFATDALQTHGRAARSGEEPLFASGPLPSRVYQGEHSLVALATGRVVIPPGGRVGARWFLALEPHRAEPFTEEEIAGWGREAAAAAGFLSQMPWQTEEPCEGGWGGDEQEGGVGGFAAPVLEQAAGSGSALSDSSLTERQPGKGVMCWFEGAVHIVSAGKEKSCLRPHGMILRTGEGWVPDEAALTATVWMHGIFLSHLTQGHTHINRALSLEAGQMGQQRCAGLRGWIFLGGRWYLLGAPAWFEMGLDRAVWRYVLPEGGSLRIGTTARHGPHQFIVAWEFETGAPAPLLFAAHLAMDGKNGRGHLLPSVEFEAGGVRVVPHPDSDLGRRFSGGEFWIGLEEPCCFDAVGGAELFDARAGDTWPFVCFRTRPGVREGGLVFEGRLLRTEGQGGAGCAELSAGVLPASRVSRGLGSEGAGFNAFCRDLLRLEVPPGHPWEGKLRRLEAVVPWFAHNAGIHYMAPRGLEQYSGGGWGVRDVCQGPVEFLLAVGRGDAVRDILVRVFGQQNPDGSWPQWFMFFNRERNIRPGEAHGDIVFWPLAALGRWLVASGEASFLAEEVEFFEQGAGGRVSPVREHVRAALGSIRSQFVPGTFLPRYGLGDWNDALQPAHISWREKLVSTWTCQLAVYALRTLAEGLAVCGESSLAEESRKLAGGIFDDFRRVAMPEGICAGLLLFEESAARQPVPLLHPADSVTGVKFSLLPLAHGVQWRIFSPAQAARHLELIARHLRGPDAARLFDKPLPWHRGAMRLFQRAEASAYCGREAGLAYMHAHLRYAEALAQWGDAGGFWGALLKAVPAGLEEDLPAAKPRQANCYYSSSDAEFATREEAAANYHLVLEGKVPLEGGWRVYSSGAGIFVAMVIQKLLGVELRHDGLLLDPVLPPELDGLKARLRLNGLGLRLTYRFYGEGRGVRRVVAGGREVGLRRVAHPYRRGPVFLPWSEMPSDGLSQEVPMEVELGESVGG